MAGDGRDGFRRFGVKGSDVDGVQHLVSVATIDDLADDRKRSS
jgi:hypothetical protein